LPLPLLTKQPNQFGTDRLSVVFVRHPLPLSQNRLDRAYQYTDNPPLLCLFDALVLPRLPVSPVPGEAVVQTSWNSIPAILPLSVQILPPMRSTDCPSALVAGTANGLCRFPVAYSSPLAATFPSPLNRSRFPRGVLSASLMSDDAPFSAVFMAVIFTSQSPATRNPGLCRLTQPLASREPFIDCHPQSASPLINCPVDVITSVALRLWNMTVELKLRALGNSVGAVIPKEALARMNVQSGDSLYLTESPDGGFRLTPTDPNFAEAMEIAEEGMRQYRNALRELAK